VVVRYHDDRSGLSIRTQSKSLGLSGRFGSEVNNLALAGDVHLLDWNDGKNTVLSDRNAYLRLAMDFGGPDTPFRITKGEVTSGSVPLEVTLAVTRDAKGDELDL